MDYCFALRLWYNYKLICIAVLSAHYFDRGNVIIGRCYGVEADILTRFSVLVLCSNGECLAVCRIFHFVSLTDYIFFS